MVIGVGEIIGFGDVVERDDYKILLGETKYFGVKRKTDTGELKIEEIKTNYGEEPEFPADSDGWEWLKTDVWGEDPVAKLGVKSGVYWEKKWFDKSDNKNKDLDVGLIRIIGRYWEEGKEDSFKVTLKTINNAEVVIKVIKPFKLGPDTLLGIAFTEFEDVFGQRHSVNEYCITESGKSGIPPQLPKAQAFKETKFRPQYRYKPWKDIRFHKITAYYNKYFKPGNAFVVQDDNMGAGKSIPSNHINLPGAQYIFSPTKAMNIIARDFRTRYWIKKEYRCVNNNEVKEDGTGGAES